MGDRVLSETTDIPAVMDVHSDVLEPINISTTQCRFVLENKGILSKDSVLQRQVSVDTAQSGKGFLPIGAGIYSVLKTATLRCGATIINKMTNPALHKSMTHSYDNPSYRQNVTRFLKGVNTTMCNINAAPNSAIGGEFTLSGMDLFDEDKCRLDYQMKLTDSSTSTPCWSIRLAELFPILYDVELPLFLMKDEVAIDLVFREQVATDSLNGVGSVACFEGTGAGVPALAGARIVTSSCLLYIDTITYENERMELIAQSVNAKEGLFLDYTDVIENVSNLKFAAVPQAATVMTKYNKTDQVPLSGFRVKNLLWGYNVLEYTTLTNPATAPPANFKFFNGLFGKYALLACREDETWDVRVNDTLVFPQPLKTSTQKATELESVYGSPVYLNQSLFSFNATATKTGVFPIPATSALLPPIAAYDSLSGIPFDSMNGLLSFNGVNFSTGWGDDNDDSLLVDQKPIEVQHQSFPVAPTDNFQRNCHYFAEVVKRFGVMDGKCQIFQQPAVQTSRQ
jgi:hypothetical protein